MRIWIPIALLLACGAPPAKQGAPPAAPVAPAAQTAAPAPAPPPAATAAPGTPPLPAGVPDTVAGRQLAWVLAVLARGGKVDAATLEEHFHPSFLDKVPVGEAAATFAALAAQLAGLRLGEVSADGDFALRARIEAQGTRLRVSLRVDEATRKIAGLLFQPDTGVKPATFEEAVAAAQKLAPRTQLLAAALERGTCRPLREQGAKAQLAIGSTFKLYVLLALAERIAAGKAKWDDELAIRDDWKSLPSGVTQDDPAGTKRTLRTLAERMISISDNTATDHLLYTVGRRQVEAALRGTGHARPALDTPFLSTRELFLFKLGMKPEEIDAYLKLPEAKRRAFLDRDLAARTPTLQGADAWTTARRIEELEWFASSEDLCRALGALWSRAQKPAGAPLLEVLAKNPGLALPKPTWRYVGFKGGSEPGVLNMTWLLERDDGRWFVVALGLNAPAGGALDVIAALDIAGGVIDLLAREGRPRAPDAAPKP